MAKKLKKIRKTLTSINFDIDVFNAIETIKQQHFSNNDDISMSALVSDICRRDPDVQRILKNPIQQQNNQ
ncbi:MAG: hypothetical protein WC365_08200 [Candidatus Babeliales bacterium]|jgi:hypothetical protein